MLVVSVGRRPERYVHMLGVVLGIGIVSGTWGAGHNAYDLGSMDVEREEG